ncbi:MAG: septum site-determining protein Ssd [Actinomycetes bacterium]
MRRQRQRDGGQTWGEQGPREGVVVGVMGGCGGAGATTLSATLARVAQDEGRDAALVDLDGWGAGLDVTLDACLEPGLRWTDLAHAQGRLSGARLVASLPTAAGLPLLTFERAAVPVTAEAALAVVEALARQRRLVVVDLPRRLEPAARAVLDCCDRRLLVTPATVPAVLSAARTMAGSTDPWSLARSEGATQSDAGPGAVPDWEAVVRHGGHAWDADVIAATLDVPLLSELPHDAGLAVLGRGELRLSRRSRYRRAVVELLTQLVPTAAEPGPFPQPAAAQPGESFAP